MFERTFSKNSNSFLYFKQFSISQVTSDLVKLKSNRELTAKDIRKSMIPVIKTCTEVMTSSGHSN